MATRNEQLLDPTRLRSLLRYDAATGHLHWLVKVSLTGDARGKPGSRAGTITKSGYVQVSVNKRTYVGHRIAWALVTGQWPQQTIDHINGERADNRWHNLRCATQSQQQGNRPHNCDGLAKIRGLSWISKDQVWQVSLAGKYLGRYRDKDVAERVFDEHARRRYGVFYIKESRRSVP